MQLGRAPQASLAAPLHAVRCAHLGQAWRPAGHAAHSLGGPRRRSRGTTVMITVPAAAAGGQRENIPQTLSEVDLKLLAEAAELSLGSVGLTQPHPNAACILVDSQGSRVGQAFQWAQGTECPELQVVRAAGAAARGSTVYMNLETGDCHGELAGVQALVRGGVRRAVVGLRHPLPHLRGAAVAELRKAGLEVQVLGEAPCSVGASSSTGSTAAPGGQSQEEAAALAACLRANEALLHRAVTGRPLGVLKYAMTADGKIATAAGHSAWVSSPESRAMVFEARAASDAVIVGGQTVRRDNPRLTTRREGGHQPVRVVMSRTLDLPEDACLWDTALAPTIVMTQRGARRDFQRRLRGRGVEVVEFDFLTPADVASYCHERGFLQLLWECGGTLAAPAIAGGVIHKAMAFVAPKLIGGCRAPTPVGDLGFVEMTQALTLAETSWQVVGPDLLLTGYLPASGGLHALAAAALTGGESPSSSSSSGERSTEVSAQGSSGEAGAAVSSSSAGAGAAARAAAGSGVGAGSVSRYSRRLAGAVEFYKAWDRWGSLSNFSPHAISMPEGAMTADRLQEYLAQQQPSSGSGSGTTTHAWSSVEHYYQAQKFEGSTHPDARALVAAIAAAASPEEAAKLGRKAQRTQPELMREDWASSQVPVMYAALHAKFTTHDGPRRMLLSTAAGPPSGVGPTSSGAAGQISNGSGGVLLVESSPHDFFWGRGFDGSGQNMLGKLLMQLRGELLTLQQQAGQQGPQQGSEHLPAVAV